mgnify:CR=1 FL=1
MTEKKSKYAPQNQADPHGYGLPDPRERILTAAEMNDLPKDVVLKYAFSQQFEDARKERERLAAMQQQQPKEKVYTESQLRAMSSSEMWERGFGGGMPGGGQG